MSGLVKSGEAAGVEGAAVVVYSAAPAIGPAHVSKFNHRDCLAAGFTDERGGFLIPVEGNDVVYRLLVARDGFEPQFVDNVVPRNGPVNCVLAPPRLKTLTSEEHWLHGRIVDAQQSPVAGAIVAPRGYMRGNEGLQGPMRDVVAVAVSDRQGRFTLRPAKVVDSVDFTASGRGLAPFQFNGVPVGTGERILRLEPGTTVRGRIVQNGKPIGGVAIGVCATRPHQTSMKYFGPWETVTDAEGRFALLHVTARAEVCLYGKMSSLKDKGSLKTVYTTTGPDLSEFNAGDLSVETGHKLTAHVRISDKKALPADLHLAVWRDDPRDWQFVPLSTGGTCEVNGLPAEIFKVGLYIPDPAPGVPRFLQRYHLSRQNGSLDPSYPFQLLGRVEEDRELDILVEPGATQWPEWPTETAEMERLQAAVQTLRKTAIAGVPPDAIGSQ